MSFYADLMAVGEKDREREKREEKGRRETEREEGGERRRRGKRGKRTFVFLNCWSLLM